MPLDETPTLVTDHVTAQLVDCAPIEPAADAPAASSPPPAATPTSQSQDATIAHTGADPPPD